MTNDKCTKTVTAMQHPCVRDPGHDGFCVPQTLFTDTHGTEEPTTDEENVA